MNGLHPNYRLMRIGGSWGDLSDTQGGGVVLMEHRVQWSQRFSRTMPVKFTDHFYIFLSLTFVLVCVRWGGLCCACAREKRFMSWKEETKRVSPVCVLSVCRCALADWLLGWLDTTGSAFVSSFCMMFFFSRLFVHASTHLSHVCGYIGQTHSDFFTYKSQYVNMCYICVGLT